MFLYRKIGLGLNTRVYKAVEVDENRRVEVKVVDFRRSKDKRKALREAYIYEKLDYQNIVKR